MLNLFKRSKPGINAMSFPSFDWNIKKEDSAIRQWLNKEQTLALSINYFEQKPDIPSITNIDIIRSYYRDQISKVNGGLIQVDIVEIQNRKAIKTIFKMPQKPTGIVYLASLTIPFKNCSYVIKIQAPEIGITGIRDAFLADKLMSEVNLLSGVSASDNWSSDPYDKDYKKGTLMNKSEKAMYDSQFEDHPLTVARKRISEIEKNIEFNSKLLKMKKFSK